jgi:hypothetical protein
VPLERLNPLGKWKIIEGMGGKTFAFRGIPIMGLGAIRATVVAPFRHEPTQKNRFPTVVGLPNVEYGRKRLSVGLTELPIWRTWQFVSKPNSLGA